MNWSIFEVDLQSVVVHVLVAWGYLGSGSDTVEPPLGSEGSLYRSNNELLTWQTPLSRHRLPVYLQHWLLWNIDPNATCWFHAIYLALPWPPPSSVRLLPRPHLPDSGFQWRLNTVWVKYLWPIRLPLVFNNSTCLPFSRPSFADPTGLPSVL